MKVRLLHNVKFNNARHRFSVTIEYPLIPERDFMFIFRDRTGDGDDCALVVDHVDGWDATHGYLLVHTKEWDIDDWRDATNISFQDAKNQLVQVVGCNQDPQDIV